MCAHRRVPPRHELRPEHLHRQPSAAASPGHACRHAAAGGSRGRRKGHRFLQDEAGAVLVAGTGWGILEQRKGVQEGRGPSPVRVPANNSTLDTRTRTQTHQKLRHGMPRQDHRPLDTVIKDLLHDGFIPSFCTACYRKVCPWRLRNQKKGKGGRNHQTRTHNHLIHVCLQYTYIHASTRATCYPRTYAHERRDGRGRPL